MLTKNLSKTLYARFASSGDGFTATHITLAAKCALTIYRKCGAGEARTFINMLRVIMLDDYARTGSRAGTIKIER